MQTRTTSDPSVTWWVVTCTPVVVSVAAVAAAAAAVAVAAVAVAAAVTVTVVAIVVAIAVVAVVAVAVAVAVAVVACLLGLLSLAIVVGSVSVVQRPRSLAPLMLCPRDRTGRAQGTSPPPPIHTQAHAAL